jgi:hypothetical protein
MHSLAVTCTYSCLKPPGSASSAAHRSTPIGDLGGFALQQQLLLWVNCVGNVHEWGGRGGIFVGMHRRGGCRQLCMGAFGVMACMPGGPWRLRCHIALLRLGMKICTVGLWCISNLLQGVVASTYAGLGCYSVQLRSGDVLSDVVAVNSAVGVLPVHWRAAGLHANSRHKHVWRVRRVAIAVPRVCSSVPPAAAARVLFVHIPCTVITKAGAVSGFPPTLAATPSCHASVANDKAFG